MKSSTRALVNIADLALLIQAESAGKAVQPRLTIEMYRSAELVGDYLEFAVALTQRGFADPRTLILDSGEHIELLDGGSWPFLSDWGLSGEMLDQARICARPHTSSQGEGYAAAKWNRTGSIGEFPTFGYTHLEAALRCFVMSQIGTWAPILVQSQASDEIDQTEVSDEEDLRCSRYGIAVGNLYVPADGTDNHLLVLEDPSRDDRVLVFDQQLQAPQLIDSFDLAYGTYQQLGALSSRIPLDLLAA